MMTRQTQALTAKLLALADDELILAHRNAEWTGHAPILEEDISLANIAQDELGHAMLWYDLYGQLTGANPDKVVFWRDAGEWRNVQLVELPKGDWAFTIVRQYLFDAYELALLARLVESQQSAIAQVAAKVRREELYHYRHTSAWVQRLGLGTVESHRRMQRALDELWPYTAQLFTPAADEHWLVQTGYTPPLAEVQAAWQATVLPWLAAATLQVPDILVRTTGRACHTPHLATLLAELQKVARLDPDTDW